MLFLPTDLCVCLTNQVRTKQNGFGGVLFNICLVQQGYKLELMILMFLNFQLKFIVMIQK